MVVFSQHQPFTLIHSGRNLRVYPHDSATRLSDQHLWSAFTVVTDSKTAHLVGALPLEKANQSSASRTLHPAVHPHYPISQTKHKLYVAISIYIFKQQNL